MTTLSITSHLQDFRSAYDVLLCDVWGVLHNGVAAFPAARSALIDWRRSGGSVVLLTNAPRPAPRIVEQLAGLGIDGIAYDHIVTSGDVTRHVLAQTKDAAVFHIGPERDLSIFEDLALRFTDQDRADVIVATGLFDDETETPEHYRAMLTEAAGRGLPMICANPDLVVERGTTLIYCAGALGALYAELGGTVTYAGKPYAPIYDLARAAARTVRREDVGLERMLAVGDSLRTDIAGANRYGIGSLFVLGGIHGAELNGSDVLDARTLRRIAPDVAVHPNAVMRRLTW